MTRRASGRIGLLLTLATVLGLAIAGSHSHAAGESSASSCVVCTVAHQPVADGQAETEVAPARETATEPGPAATDLPSSTPAFVRLPRAPPV